MPSWRASDGRGNPPVCPRRPDGNGRRRGFRLPGFIRFLLFAGVLAALVLLVLLTALRPVVRAGVVGWAWDNPSAITRFPFVADLVREDLGDALTRRRAPTRPRRVFTVNPGDTHRRPRAAAPRGRLRHERAGVPVRGAHDRASNEKLTSGNFLLRKNMTAAEVADALVDGPRRRRRRSTSRSARACGSSR